MGIEIIAAPKVTRSDPRIKGKMPNCGGSEIGYQFLPKRKLSAETFLKTERPSLSRKRKIRTTKIIEARPQKRISFSIRNSLNLLMIFSV
jgi:hypothetical protein